MAIRVQIVLFDGFDPLGAVTSYEVLRAGGTATGGAIAVDLVSPDGTGPVPGGSGGLVLHVTGRLDPDRADVVIVPGVAGASGAGLDGVPPPLERALETELPALLKHALDSPDITVAAVGAGALVLATAGLIGGRPVASRRADAGLLEGYDVVAVPARVVDDGDLVTAGGITAGVDLALYLLERELGPRIAHAVEQSLAYERRGTAWRREGAEPVV